MILVDTNVLLDVASADPHWASWSVGSLQAAALEGPLLINCVIYAELSVRYATVEDLDEFLDRAGTVMQDIPAGALFIVGKAFSTYRKAGGRRTGVLPDFFIGAHAALLDIPILTRDVTKYRTYFPTVTLRAPLRGH